MSDQTSRISNEVFKGEKFIEAYTLCSESFERNIQQNKKFCQRNIDENRSSTI